MGLMSTMMYLEKGWKNV